GGATGLGAVVLLTVVGLLAGVTYLLLNQVLLDRLDKQNIAGVTGLLGAVLGLGLALSSFGLGVLVEQGYYRELLFWGAAVSAAVSAGQWWRSRTR
ncbi:hypothetical protein, partial [Candidatus Cyanaurora vandensis]|uniref:hypothetical protein n=1 Tax=Candidatus Cyanaurora vandensis TaxID=2714958 RepID=UPI00257E46FF